LVLVSFYKVISETLGWLYDTIALHFAVAINKYG